MKIIKSILVIPAGLIIGLLVGLTALVILPVVTVRDLLEDVWNG